MPRPHELLYVYVCLARDITYCCDRDRGRPYIILIVSIPTYRLVEDLELARAVHFMQNKAEKQHSIDMLMSMIYNTFASIPM